MIIFSFFRTDFKNLIVFDFSDYKLKNSEKDSLKGFSSSLNYLFGKHKLSLSFTKLNAKNLNTGEPLLRRPSYIGKGFVNFLFGKFNIIFGGRFVGKRKDFDEKTYLIVDAEDFSVFYLNLRYSLFKNLSFFFKINNVFNKDFYEIYGYPSPKRWVFGGVSLHF